MIRPFPAVVAFSLVALLTPSSSRGQDAPADDALAHARATYAKRGPKAALHEYEAVLDGYRRTHDVRGEAITIGLIGNCYKRLGEYPKALNLLTKALELKREIHDRAEEGRTLSHLGLVYWEQGEYSKAISSFNESISIAQDIHDTQLEAASLNNLSLVYDEKGDYRRSLEQYRHALDLHRSVKYEPGESDTLGNIGGVYLLLGHYSEAEGYYREALAISERLGLKPSETLDLGNIAQCLLGQGKLQDSLASYDQAIALARDSGLVKEEADWYRGKASALLHVGRFEDAIKSYESAEQTYVKAGLKRELVEDLGDLGAAYLSLGDRSAAESRFRKAASLARRIGHQRGVVVNRLALAEVQLRSKSYVEAQKTATTALADAQALNDSAEIAGGLLLLGQILRDQHLLTLALKRTTEGLEIAERDGLRLLEGEALEQEGELQSRLGHAEVAMDRLNRALEIATQMGDVDLLWKANYERGQVFEQLHRYDDAVGAYRDSVETIERVRTQIAKRQFRTGYFQNKQDAYVALIRLLLRMGRAGEAFESSEDLRKYAYLNLRKEKLATVPSPGIEAENQMRRLNERIANERNRPLNQQRAEAIRLLSEELEKAQQGYAELLASGGDQGLRNPPRRSTVSEIRQRVPINTALLEYVVADQSLSVFVLTRDTFQAVTKQTSERNLRSKIELFRDLVANPAKDEWRAPAKSLYSLLIEPLEREGLLKGIRSLMIVPHGVLTYLPFSALPTGDRTFLIQRYEISEIPAASLLAASRERNTAVDRVLSFAPSHSGLRFAIPEARSIASAFAPRGTAIVGKDATKARFTAIAPQSDIVHIATHGFFNYTAPSLSGLQLEPSGGDDGRLVVQDILGMRLNARLVTLSACETALGGGPLGEIPAGDEFVGLNRSFLEAGSDAVLASLWSIDDRATLLVMRRFYESILHENGAAALARAQRLMLWLPKFRHPYYWAAFVLVSRTADPAGKDLHGKTAAVSVN